MSNNYRIMMRYCIRALLLGVVWAWGALLTSPALAVPALATNDSYTIEANFTLTVNAAAGLVANDSGFNPATHRIESYDTRSAFGGSVQVNADGGFTYVPPPGFIGVDTFAYIIRTDEGAASAIVSVNVVGPIIWFVDASAPAGGDGSYARPFNSFVSLNGAGDADAAGDTIFIYAGTYSVALALENGQQLIGEAQGLNVPNAGIVIPAGSAPILNATSGHTLTVANDNTVRGLTLRAASGYALAASGITGLTVGNVSIQNAVGGITFDSVSGAVTFTNVPINTTLNSGNAGLSILNSSATISLINSPITTTVGHPLRVATYTGTLTLDSASDISSTSGQSLLLNQLSATAVVTLGGVNITTGGGHSVELSNNNANAQVNFEEGVTANATNGAAFISYLGGGKLKISGTTNSLTSNGQTALHLSGVELTQGVTFASLNSTNSTGYGLFIQNPVGTHDVSVTGTTTLTNVQGLGIYIDDSATPSGFTLNLTKAVISSTSTGIAVAGAGVTVADSTSTLITTGGAAVYCTNSTTNLAFTTLSAADGPNALFFSSCSGTISAVGGSLTSTAGVNNHVVSISNSTVNLSYNGTISKTNQGRAVSIDGLTNPGAVTFVGAVTASNASSGVAIQNSTRAVTFNALTLGASAARFNFTPLLLAGNTGAVDLGTFQSYTSSGAVALNINYSNASPGTVTTDTGSLLDASGNTIALNVSHSSSQPLNLTFDSITTTGGGTHGIDIDRASGTFSVTGLINIGAKTTAGVEITNANLTTTFKELDINGAARGVGLSNNTGSFTISGDGDTSLNTDGAGGTMTNIVGNAFNFNTVTNITLNDLQITNVDNDVFFGTSVLNLALDNVDVTDAGDAADEFVMDFSSGSGNLSGTVTLDNVYFTNMADDAVAITNSSGTLDMTITNSEFENNISKDVCAGNCAGMGVRYDGTGTSTATITISNSTFDRIDTVGVSASTTGTNNPLLTLNVLNNTFAGQTYVSNNPDNSERAIFVPFTSGNGVITTRIEGNTITNHANPNFGVIQLNNAENQWLNATIQGNNISFYSPIGRNISLYYEADSAYMGQLIASIRNNTLAGGNTGAISATGTGTGVSENNVTITMNQIANAPAFGFRAVSVELFSGNFSSSMCSHITGNTINAAPERAINIVAAIGAGQVRLQGMSGTGDANAITYLQANNSVTGAVFVNTGNSITSATCRTP